LDVFEHVEGPATCLQNLGAVLRPGGCLLLSYPNTHPDKPHGVTRFSRKEDIAELLAEAGFSRWEIFPIRLRRSAAKIYDALHEWPIELHRRLRRNGPDGDPQIYEATWAFQQRQKLVRYKVPLHAFWVALGQTMRLGGDVFVAGPVTDEILGRQLVVRAWK
jgi:SAM-dependent methyltransferase